MTDSTAVREAEGVLLDATRRIAMPKEGECLCCFVIRMIDQHGCDTTLRWSQRFRDLRAPRATALESRLSRMGGFCDCEIFMNGVSLAPHLQVVGRNEYDEIVDVRWPAPLPECAAVRRGSTRWCSNWERQTRRRMW